MKDGRFVAAIPTTGFNPTTLRELRVVTNWFEELKRLVPAVQSGPRRDP